MLIKYKHWNGAVKEISLLAAVTPQENVDNCLVLGVLLSKLVEKKVLTIYEALDIISEDLSKFEITGEI